MVLGINTAVGVQLTDQLSVGAALTLGTGFEQLGFIGPLSSNAMVHDYAAGTCGVTYDLNGCNTIGVYYQSKMNFQFPNAISFNSGPYRDLRVDQPQTFGIGVSHHSLMDGDLLIAADVYYKLWDNAALWQDVFVNQWAFAVAPTDLRAMQVPPGLLVQQQSHQPQRRRQPGRLPGGTGHRAALPGRVRALCQSTPHHLRRGARRFLGAEPRPGHLCRLSPQAIEPVRHQYASLAGHVLPRPGFDLAVRHVESACVQFDDGQGRHDAGCHVVGVPDNSEVSMVDRESGSSFRSARCRQNAAGRPRETSSNYLISRELRSLGLGLLLGRARGSRQPR